MFKRILFMTMFAVILSVTSIANASPQSDLLSKYVDMRLSLDVGINRLDFDRAYRELYVATKKQESQMSPEEISKFNDVLKVYNDVSFMWGAYRDLYYASDLKNYLNDKYPDIYQSVQHDFWGQYDRRAVVRFLMGKSVEPQKALEKYFADKAKAEQEAKKTSE